MAGFRRITNRRMVSFRVGQKLLSGARQECRGQSSPYSWTDRWLKDEIMRLEEICHSFRQHFHQLGAYLSEEYRTSRRPELLAALARRDHSVAEDTHLCTAPVA